jgi:hypothetical protein
LPDYSFLVNFTERDLSHKVTATKQFKKANAPSRLADFDTQPTWGDLASKIAKLFDIPLKDVGVAFVDKCNDVITLNSEQDLQRFYRSLDQSSEEIKFVVQDLRTPDGESAFSFIHPPPVSLLVLYPPMSYISNPLLSALAF